ncbi:snRNA-activating protein complex subunit 3 isoform 2-T2 [Mantella aurantiaca]
MAEELTANIPVFEVTHVTTQKFHVSSFGALWRGSLSECDLSLDKDNPPDEDDAELAAELGCPVDTAAELRLLCSIDELKTNVVNNEADPEEIPEDTTLMTLGVRKKEVERRKELLMDRAYRMETFMCEMESRGLGRRPEDPSDMVDEGELVLTLNLLYPMIFHKHKYFKPYETILVLGSQRLAELRDAIKCVSDLQIGGEFSNNPDMAPENICKDLFKSAFFYFEGIFYNDMRYPECRDLSRLIHHDDCLDRNLYPLHVRKHWICTRKCHVCKLYIAKWVTKNDSFAPDDPCFFCDVCFKMLHYDREGNKLGDFVAYAYVDPGTFN